MKQNWKIFFLGPNFKAPIQEMPMENGPVHVACSIITNDVASARKEKLRGLFENRQKETSTRTVLAKMGHVQSPTPVAKDNTLANSIVNGTAKRKISRVIDMIFYCV